jgi:nucleoside-diphosphate kinase
VPYFNRKNLYVGGTVHIFGREMKVTDYGDQFTKNALKVQDESTFAMIKPDAFRHLGNLVIQYWVNF